MQWANLQTHGDTPHRAFEALCSLLFERWCHREYPQRVTRVYVTGAGGDGGVESLARLDDGSTIGLQCKWFRDPLQRGQFAQIKSSLKTAAQLRAGLSRYVVAVPRNLADGVDSDDSNTERQRWDAFVTQARVDFPNVSIELWDESLLERLLAELGGKGVVSYWFSHVVVDQGRLERLFKQAKTGWLANRYSPDLHQAGEIEKEVEVRLNRQDLPIEWQHWCAVLRRSIRDAQAAITHLAHIEGVSDASSLASANASLVRLAQYADALAARLNGPATPSAPVPLSEPVLDVEGLLAFLEDKMRGDESVHHHRKVLSTLVEEWDKQSVSVAELDAFASPVLFVAGAGAGKTHACAHIVERALARSEPAVLIRARDFAPGSTSWTLILQRSLEEHGLSLEEVLDALVSAARLVDVRNAAANGGQETTHPCRPLVAVDGLDESPGATGWATRLAELSASIGPRPLTFVATCRPSALRNLTEPCEVSFIQVEGSDPDLDAVFAAYIKASRIDAPPVLRWWLRSPLEVRLFADAFEGASRSALSMHTFRIHDLIRRKLELIAEAVAQTQGVTAAIAAPLVRKKLVDFADALLQAGDAVTHTTALACLRGSGADEFPNAMLVLETLRDRGILLEIPSTTIDPLADEGPRWDFAFETLHSYVVASRYSDAPGPESLPYLRQHPQALLFTLVLQENSGRKMLLDEGWSAGLWESEVLDLRLTALSLMEFPKAQHHRKFVEDQLVASMPACRAVLSHLVMPGMRVPGYPFGARFVFETIRDVGVAVRDVFWSGPRDLNSKDAPWAGHGVEAIEGEALRAADPWDTAPLLVLMSSSSVVEAHRHEVVRGIARWGIEQPSGLSKLLQLLFEGFNDPQVLEDAVAAAWAAVSLKPSADWSELVKVVRAGRWERAFPHVPTLGFVRYCELVVSMVEKKRAGLNIAAPTTLPIDRGVGESVDKESGYGPIRGDLTWYVVPRRIGVFDRPPAEYGPGDGSTFDEWEWDRNRDEILQAFIDGRIRKDAPKEARDEARRVVELINEERAKPYGPVGTRRNRDEDNNESDDGDDADDDEADRNDTSDVADGVGKPGDANDGNGDENEDDEGEDDEGEGDEREDDEGEDDEGEDDEGEDDEGEDDDDSKSDTADTEVSRSAKEPPWGERLRELLQRHAEENGLGKLTLRAFAFGYVMARAAQMGWTEALRDGDRAIHGTYGRATHGSRSEVCSFFEKYLWLALGELRTFLCLQLADADPKGRLAPDRIEDVDNPTDLMDEVTVHVPLSRWDALVASSNLTEKWEQDRANEWVRLAPPVSIMDAAFFSGRDLRTTSGTPGVLPDNSDWIAIEGYLHLREAISQADRLVWLAALLVEAEDIAVLEEEAQAGLLLSRHDLDDAHTGLARDGTYVGPFEALWMTDAEIQTPLTHTTVAVQDTKVVIAQIPMYPAVVESHWKGLKERTFSYPSKDLRESLGISAYSNGCFRRADGTIVAVHAQIEGADESNEGRWGPPSGDWLLVRRDLLVEQLKGKVALLVTMQARTEAAGHLKEREVGWDRIEQRSMVIVDGLTVRAPIEEIRRERLPETGPASAVSAITSLVNGSDSGPEDDVGTKGQ